LEDCGRKQFDVCGWNEEIEIFEYLDIEILPRPISMEKANFCFRIELFCYVFE